MSREEWLRAFCERIGVDAPTPAEEEQLLELAAVAAHSSERDEALRPLCRAAPRGRSSVRRRFRLRRRAPYLGSSVIVATDR
jgi:hypothetical protein